MTTDSGLKDLFKKSGALLEGHFLLSSGLHSDQYFQCALLLSDVALAERMGRDLAAKMPKDWAPTAVVGPALGGVVIGHEVARALGLRSLFTERKDGAMELRRGFKVSPGERVVVVEDVITTGKSTREVIALLRELGAEPVGALSIVVRAAEAPELGVPSEHLARLPAAAWGTQECALCRAGLPVVKPGSREKPSLRG
jgi:orotate phosphoribosyltransferase